MGGRMLKCCRQTHTAMVDQTFMNPWLLHSIVTKEYVNRGRRYAESGVGVDNCLRAPQKATIQYAAKNSTPATPPPSAIKRNPLCGVMLKPARTGVSNADTPTPMSGDCNIRSTISG